jgi:hypothetical protein
MAREEAATMRRNEHFLRGAALAAGIALCCQAAGGGEVRVRTPAELRAALSKLTPGTTVLIAPGSYGGGYTVRKAGGTEEAPIVIRGAEAGRPPVFKGGAEAWHLVDCSWVRLSHLSVSGSRSNGINIDDGGDFATPARGITVEDVTIRDVGPRGNCDGLKLSGLVGFAVRRCTFEGWGGSAIDMVGCHQGVVADCTFKGKAGFSSHSGVQVKGGSRHVRIVTSYFEEAGLRAINLGGSTGLKYFRPKAKDFEASEITVAGNRFVGSEAPVAFVTAIGGHVHHNTFVNPRKWLLRILQETRDERFRPCREGVFENNLVVCARPLKVVVNVGPRTAPRTFRFRRNAWFSPRREPPKLPAKETEGVYGVDPKLKPAAGPGMKITSTDPRLRGIGADAYEPPKAATTRPAVEPKDVGVKVDPKAASPVKYVQVVLRSKAMAQRMRCQANLKSVGTALVMYEAMHGKLPASLKALVKAGLLTEAATRSPVPDGGPFTYIPRKRMRRGRDIVVYDGRVSYAGQCCALRADGSVVGMSPEALEAAVKQTHERLSQ